MMKRFLASVAVASTATLAFSVGTAGAARHAPTCSEALGITVHGQHVVGDYVAGIDHSDLAWPPSGGVVGAAVSANGGVAVAGGPGPGFHFVYGVAPGASFCTGSESPGVHV